MHWDIENSWIKCSAEKLSTSCIWSGIFPPPSYRVHLFDQDISYCLPVSSFTMCIHVPKMSICANLTPEFSLTSHISSTAATEDATMSNTLCLTWGIKPRLVMFSSLHRWLLKSSLSSVMHIGSTPDRHKPRAFHCWSWICTTRATASYPSAVINSGMDWLTICFIFLSHHNEASAVSFYYFTLYHH